MIGSFQAPQREGARVDEPQPGRQVVSDERRRRRGHDDLVAPGDGQEPGRSIHRRSEVVPVTLNGFSRVKGHADLQAGSWRPGERLQHPADRQYGVQSGGGSLEGHAETVAPGSEHKAACILDRISDESVVSLQGNPHLVRMPIPQPGRVLDIGD
jgi:hypothetical protein